MLRPFPIYRPVLACIYLLATAAIGWAGPVPTPKPPAIPTAAFTYPAPFPTATPPVMIYCSPTSNEVASCAGTCENAYTCDMCCYQNFDPYPVATDNDFRACKLACHIKHNLPYFLCGESPVFDVAQCHSQYRCPEVTQCQACCANFFPNLRSNEYKYCRIQCSL